MAGLTKKAVAAKLREAGHLDAALAVMLDFKDAPDEGEGTPPAPAAPAAPSTTRGPSMR